jgi:hypothetical protein
MNDSTETFRTFFLAIWRAQRAAWGEAGFGTKPSAAAIATRERLELTWRHVTEQELERYLPSKTQLVFDFWKKKAFLYLPPLEDDKGFVPVLIMKYDFSGKIKDVVFQVMLTQASENNDDEAVVCEFQCIGFRFENGKGRHSFHHTQLIRSFESTPLAVGMCSPLWLPETDPAMPLVAKCPITLVVSMFIALYGKDLFDKFRKEYTNIYRLDTYLNPMKEWID